MSYIFDHLNMRLPAVLLVLLGCCSTAKAQQNYSAELIPKELLPYASAVIRNQEISYVVKDNDNVIYHLKEAVTVLNKNGDSMAGINLWHDKNSVIKSVKGAMYNSAGVQTGKFSESNFEDDNTDDGYSLFQDLKLKHFKPAGTDYPYTIEYEYEEKIKQSLNFEDWQPNYGYGVSVEKSSYSFTCKKDFKIRYKEINLPSSVSIGQDKDGSDVYQWKISDLKAVKNEPYSPAADKYSSIVKIAPVTFNYDGLQGTFTNWQQLGKWNYDKMLANRQMLPDITVDHVKDITAGITDPKLKAKKIYEYMQGKSHYISVQIGIGGYQPFLAADVDRLNYGDCKALVNYTQALLTAAGIDSWYCVVTANSDKKVSMINDFASMEQGNHIILCLPFKNDTTWCDCTSQTLPFGYLGDFTDDRSVLACTPTGGKLLRTPKYSADNSLQDRKAEFTLSLDGQISGDMTTTFRGTQYDNREGIINESKTDQLKWMQRIYSINNMEIAKLQFTQDKGLQPVTTEQITLKAGDYANHDNDRINITPNIVNRMTKAPHEVLNRKTDVYINEGYTDQDEISYILPAGYHSGSQPLNVNVKTQFGTFSASTAIKDGKLIYKRRLQVLDGTYSKDSYQDLVDFFQQVVDADSFDEILEKNAN